MTSREGSSINTRERCQEFIGAGNNDVAAREGQSAESKIPRQTNYLCSPESKWIFGEFITLGTVFSHKDVIQLVHALFTLF